MAEHDGALLEQPAARTHEREDGLGSALGQKLTFTRSASMSAKCHQQTFLACFTEQPRDQT
jgi:hypothetical protein